MGYDFQASIVIQTVLTESANRVAGDSTWQDRKPKI